MPLPGSGASVLSKCPSRPVVRKDVTVNILTARAIVYSGSVRSLIRKRIAEKLDIAKSCPPLVLNGFGETLVECVQKVSVNVKIDDDTFKADLFLVEDHLPAGFNLPIWK